MSTDMLSLIKEYRQMLKLEVKPEMVQYVQDAPKVLQNNILLDKLGGIHYDKVLMATLVEALEANKA